MFLELNDANIYYEITGEGRPIILIHGFPFNTEMWEKQVKFLSVKGFKVITLDLRGHGKSTGIPKTIEQMGNDIISLIKYLKLNKPIITGMSMGGYIAFELSVSFNELFSGGIYISTKAGGDNEEVKKVRNQLIEDIKKSGAQAVLDFYIDKLFSPVTVKDNPKLIEKTKEWILNNSPEVLIGATGAMRDRNDNMEKLNKITFPTLIISGKDDPMIPPNIVKEHVKKLENCEFEIFENSGHMVNIELYNEVNDKLFGWLKSIK